MAWSLAAPALTVAVAVWLAAWDPAALAGRAGPVCAAGAAAAPQAASKATGRAITVRCAMR